MFGFTQTLRCASRGGARGAATAAADTACLAATGSLPNSSTRLTHAAWLVSITPWLWFS